MTSVGTSEWERREGPPENEIPGPLGWAGLLGSGPDFAVILISAAAYSTGLRLDVGIRARVAVPGEELFDAIDDTSNRPDRLHLVVEFADGRTSTNQPVRHLASDAPSLRLGGAWGSDRWIDLTMFVHPLPPLGPLAVVCSWPGHGIAPTRTALDSASAHTAAQRVQLLWRPP